MEITIFERTNRGIVISKEGETFLGYARQVLEQAALLEETYKKKPGGNRSFVFPPSIIRLQSMHLWN